MALDSAVHEGSSPLLGMGKMGRLLTSQVSLCVMDRPLRTGGADTARHSPQRSPAVGFDRLRHANHSVFQDCGWRNYESDAGSHHECWESQTVGGVSWQ